jgi:hypothetical protein
VLVHFADNDDDHEEGIQLVDALRARKLAYVTKVYRPPPGGHTLTAGGSKTWNRQYTGAARPWNRVWAFLGRA